MMEHRDTSLHDLITRTFATVEARRHDLRRNRASGDTDQPFRLKVDNAF
jgi:hypothetical protein